MKLRTTVLAAALSLALGSASAATLRVANQGDVNSMDPHSLNESLQLSFTGSIYEPLVNRDKKLGLVPGLATSWKQTAPAVWRFELRRNVQFHDGTPFTADDVVFTFQRAAADGSDMKSYTSPIKEVRKAGTDAVDIETHSPFPILPDTLSTLYVMSRKWSLKVQTETDQARRDAMIREAFEVHAADVGHIPLHQQALAWAVKKDVEIVQLADNFMFFKWIRKAGNGAAAR